MLTQLKLPPQEDTDEYVPTPDDMPFHRLGGEEGLMALSHTFYDFMESTEPELTGIHELTPEGKITQDLRERFGYFLMMWTGGPPHYMDRYGHPALRMRHAHVVVDIFMRDAWIRAMQKALDAKGVKGGVRRFMDDRFAHIADFLRNVEG